jgi:hypothetical protein
MGKYTKEFPKEERSNNEVYISHKNKDFSTIVATQGHYKCDHFSLAKIQTKHRGAAFQIKLLLCNPNSPHQQKYTSTTSQASPNQCQSTKKNYLSLLATKKLSNM